MPTVGPGENDRHPGTTPLASETCLVSPRPRRAKVPVVTVVRAGAQKVRKRSRSRPRTPENSGSSPRPFALPHELPEWAERSNLWHTYYQPRSPASMHLTNECARATLMADRCESYRQATIEKQTQKETQKFHVAEKRKASHLARDLRIQPASTVEKLGAFGEGARSHGPGC